MSGWILPRHASSARAARGSAQRDQGGASVSGAASRPASYATLRGVPEPGDPARRLPHVAPPVIPATDLGGVTVLERAGVFLLTDPFDDGYPTRAVWAVRRRHAWE